MRLNSIILISLSLLILIACEEEGTTPIAGTAVESISGTHSISWISINGIKNRGGGTMTFWALTDSTVRLRFSYTEHIDSPRALNFTTSDPIFVYGRAYDVQFETTEIIPISWEGKYYLDTELHVKGHIYEPNLMDKTRFTPRSDHFIGNITIMIKSPEGLDLVLSIEETSKGN